MTTRNCVSIALLACFSCSAQAAVSGKCTYEGKPLVFVDAYAALAPDPFEETKKVPTLWLATKKLDQALLSAADADDIDDAVTEQAFEHELTKLELRFDAEGTVVEAMQMYVPPGTSRSVSGNDVGELTLKAPMKTRATGRWVLGDDDDLKCDVQFDVPISGRGPKPPPPKPWGTALPKGGGEPGKVYMAMHRATLAGDADQMVKFATKARAAEMQEARKKPEFPQMVKMIQAFEPVEVHVVSGQSDGKRAELKIAGKDSDGSTMTGDVKLVLEDGTWRIENVNTKSKSN